VNCTVRLGNARISIAEFLKLRAGDVVQLDQKTEQGLTFLVGNVPKYQGKPALQGKKLVFSVSDTIDE
jgi:flagellar motor switch protein FliM